MPISRDISQAAEILRNGGVVALPTETVYGLAGAINSELAIQRIFQVKERPLFDPLIVHISDFSQLSELVTDIPKAVKKLAKTFWPGPLTIVLPKRDMVSGLITAGLETVAVRIPAHSLTRELITAVGVPLAAPSANKFGKTSPTTAEHVRNDFGADLFILDGGECEIGIESTVIDFSGEALRILRPGAITAKMFEDLLGGEVLRAVSSASPGHLEQHYQPRVPLVIVGPNWEEEQVKARLSLSNFSPGIIQLDRDPRIAARTLYSQLRNTAGKNCLIVEKSEENSTPEWEAIWDRLNRAASYT